MKISLDTNVWIFGLFNIDPYCRTIILNLVAFDVVVPNQIRAELERNLPEPEMKTFYRLAGEAGVRFDFASVPAEYLAKFEAQGLKRETWSLVRIVSGKMSRPLSRIIAIS